MSSASALTGDLSGHAVYDLPLSEVVFVAFDTETTGRNPIVSKLVEVSGVKFHGNGQLIDTRTHLINPGVSIPSEVTAIHGITDEMVQHMPSCQAIIPDFVNWMADSGKNDKPTVFVAHNASFDIGFLQVSLAKIKHPLPINPVLDTLGLSRKLIKDSPNHKLKTLTEHLNIASSTYHRAEADSFHVRGLLMALMERLPETSTFRDLANTSGVLYFNNPFLDKDPAASSDFRIRTIDRALCDGQDLKISYNGTGIRSRTITPLSMLHSNGFYYVSAFCHAAVSDRTFRIDKISTIELVTRNPETQES